MKDVHDDQIIHDLLASRDEGYEEPLGHAQGMVFGFCLGVLSWGFVLGLIL